jgi:transposase
VIAAIDDGGDAYELAPLFHVSVSYIYKILGRRRTTGETTVRAHRHGPLPRLVPYDDALRAQVATVPDATLAELRAWLLSKHKVKIGITCLWKRLRHLGLTLKKSPRALPNRIARMSPRHGRSGERTSPL